MLTEKCAVNTKVQEETMSLRLRFEKKKDSPYRVLCLGAHADDIEIGCGATILKLIEDYDNVEFYWVVFSGDPVRAAEARSSASMFLKEAFGQHIVVKGFKDSFFNFIGSDIKEYFLQLRKEFEPDIIFTHYRNDLHQDHRVISELTWNTYRDHLILEYEIPKYDGDLGTPNFFVCPSHVQCKKKVRYIMDSFGSQEGRGWFTEDTFLSIMRIRGIESNASNKYAEGFYCRKIIL